jgi:hypothetical protein
MGTHPSSRVTLAGQSDQLRTIDLARSMIASVAAELHRIRGGNDVLNWLEAEKFVLDLLRLAQQGKTDEAITTESTQGTSRSQETTVEPKPEATAVASSVGGGHSQHTDEEIDPFAGRMPRPRFGRSSYRYAA